MPTGKTEKSKKSRKKKRELEKNNNGSEKPNKDKKCRKAEKLKGKGKRDNLSSEIFRSKYNRNCRGGENKNKLKWLQHLLITILLKKDGVRLNKN